MPNYDHCNYVEEFKFGTNLIRKEEQTDGSCQHRGNWDHWYKLRCCGDKLVITVYSNIRCTGTWSSTEFTLETGRTFVAEGTGYTAIGVHCGLSVDCRFAKFLEAFVYNHETGVTGTCWNLNRAWPGDRHTYLVDHCYMKKNNQHTIWYEKYTCTDDRGIGQQTLTVYTSAANCASGVQNVYQRTIDVTDCVAGCPEESSLFRGGTYCTPRSQFKREILQCPLPVSPDDKPECPILTSSPTTGSPSSSPTTSSPTNLPSSSPTTSSPTTSSPSTSSPSTASPSTSSPSTSSPSTASPSTSSPSTSSPTIEVVPVVHVDVRLTVPDGFAEKFEELEDDAVCSLMEQTARDMMDEATASGVSVTVTDCHLGSDDAGKNRCADCDADGAKQGSDPRRRSLLGNSETLIMSYDAVPDEGTDDENLAALKSKIEEAAGTPHSMDLVIGDETFNASVAAVVEVVRPATHSPEAPLVSIERQVVQICVNCVPGGSDSNGCESLLAAAKELLCRTQQEGGGFSQEACDALVEEYKLMPSSFTAPCSRERSLLSANDEEERVIQLMLRGDAPDIGDNICDRMLSDPVLRAQSTGCRQGMMNGNGTVDLFPSSEVVPQGKKEEGGKLSSAALGGIIAASITLVLLIVFAVYKYWNRNQGQSNEEEDAKADKAVDEGDEDALKGLKEEDIRDYKGDGESKEQDIP